MSKDVEKMRRRLERVGLTVTENSDGHYCVKQGRRRVAQ
jgi:hypothetical protein